jgi:hypothetical protein
MHYLYSYKRLVLKKIVVGMFLFTGFASFVSAAAWNLPGVTIVTRAQW